MIMLSVSEVALYAMTPNRRWHRRRQALTSSSGFAAVRHPVQRDFVRRGGPRMTALSITGIEFKKKSGADRKKYPFIAEAKSLTEKITSRNYWE